MEKIPNAQLRNLNGEIKGVNERIDEGTFREFGRVERMESDKIAKSVYVGKIVGRRCDMRPRRRWNDTVKDCLKKRGLDIRQARRMVHNKSE